ncbi:MAG: DUF554 family protein [Actinobacteria bacterium]|uniref:Unannotated protein n=1 Tax=freshwater metagenome TaxID=449393 RepID=A0A6J6EB76_9ZZZZ|nr:DUF554 family protein [Actinomycetota bacterium]
MNDLFVGAGTVLNVVCIVAGAIIGGLLGNRLSNRLRELVTDVLGLVTLLVGIMSAWLISSAQLNDEVGDGFAILVLLGALLIGGILGTWLKITERFDSVGAFLNSKFNSGGESAKFIEGFVSASLLFVVGPLAIMGSISDGLGTGLDQLVLKSSLDFFAAMAFAASFGAFGVAASALSVGSYQGLFTLVGVLAGSALSVAQIDALTATGGVLLIGVGLRLLAIKQVKVADLLPALLIAPLLVSLLARI